MHSLTNMQTLRNNKKGVALLFVVIISGLLVGIGAAMMRIFTKDIILTSTTRESTVALYQADSGYECALFHDYNSRAFDPSNPASALRCAGEDVAVTSSNSGRCLGAGANPSGVPGSVRARTFWLGGGVGNTNACTCVDVYQWFENPNPPDDPGIRKTLVESRGYNTCDDTSDRRLERAIRVRY